MMKHRREIFAIAVPAIVSNITTPILGLVDVAVTGHIGAAVYIGAIAVGGSMFNMLYWLCNFLRMGTSGLTAQAYGAADSANQARILYRALLVGLVLGLLIFALQRPLADVILRFMDADDVTQALASQYFSICVWAAPAVTATLGISGWLLGMQNSRATMVIAISTNVVNVALSVGLVFGAGWKIEGVATGTMVAQWFGALLGLGIIIWKYRPAFPGLGIIFESKSLKGFFRINTDIMLRTACLVAVTMWFTHAGAIQSTEILAANALLLQLFMLFSYFMDGFAFSGEALAGKYHGAGNSGALDSLIADILRVGLWCALVFAALYALLGETFLRVLAEDKSVVATAATYLPWAAAIPLCGFMAFAWDGILIGLTRTRIMLAAMGAAMLAFFALYLLLFRHWSNHALWLAFDIYLIVRGAAEWILYRHQTHKNYGNP